MIEENVIEIIDITDTVLLRQSAKLVFVYEDFFVLSTTYRSVRSTLAREGNAAKISYIGHIPSDAVIQLTTALIEDMHIQNSSVVV